MNKKTLQSIALFSSINLASLFIAYRSGYFSNNDDKSNKKPISFSNSIFDSSISKSAIDITKTNSLKKDSPTVNSFEPLDFKSINIDFDQLLKNALAKNDTVEIKLPDSLFILNDSSLFIKDKLVNRDSFENYLYNNLNMAYNNQSAIRLSSSKSMAVFNTGDVIINFKNYKFQYNKIIPQNILQYPQLFKSKLNYLWFGNDQNELLLDTKGVTPKTFFSNIDLQQNEMMLSSKSGYVISRDDMKKVTLKNINEIVGSSKYRILFSKEDLKKDSSTPINNDSINKIKEQVRLSASSKSMIIFDSRDVKQKQKAFIKKLKDSIIKANK